MADRSLEKTEILAGGDPRLQPRLGRYRLERRLGAGGMAEVFLARAEGALGFEKQVVVKRIRPQLAANKKFVEMFLREARVLARLDHPNIVRIIELDESKGEYFLALEYLEGLSLREVAERHWSVGRPLPVESLMQIVADAAMGLDYAHKQRDQQGNLLNLVHRDVSPDNLFVTTTGTVKVIDFGIAKLEGNDQLTQAGELKGKIPFMSPEQLQGVTLDARTDLFALGITFYWLLTGRRPFDGSTDVHTMKAILEDPPPPIRTYNTKIPALLEDVVGSLLQKDRGKRMTSAAHLHDALGTLLMALPRAAPPASLLVDAAQTLPAMDHEVVPAGLAAVPVLPWPDKAPEDAFANAETKQQRVAAVPLNNEGTQRIPVYAPARATQVVSDAMFTTAEHERVSSSPSGEVTDFKVPSDPIIDVERVPAVDATLAVEPVKAFSTGDGDVVTAVNHATVEVPPVRGPVSVEAELVEDQSRAVPIAAGVFSALVVVGAALWFGGVVESVMKIGGVADAGFAESVLTVPEFHDAGEVAVVVDAGMMAVVDAGEVAVVDAGEEMPEGEVDAGAFGEEEEEEEEPKGSTRPKRRAVQVLAPPSVQWQGSSGEVYGAGRGTLRVPESVKVVYAVDLRRGGKTRINLDRGTRVVDWNKLPRQKLNIRVRPYADVFLGKEAFGTTPIAPINVVVGTYEVRLVYKGVTKTVSVDVGEKKPAVLNVVMK